MPRSEFNFDGNGATYVRVSEEEQDESRQRRALDDCLARHGVTVEPHHDYVDINWKRWQADIRPAFNKMLRAADRGEINWILIDDQDRAECVDEFETFAVLHRLRKAGCRLYTVDGLELTNDDVASTVTTLVKSSTSRGEQITKSKRVLEKARQRAEQGDWLGGRVPYGMDVVAFKIVGGEHIEQWRVEIVGEQKRVKIEADGRRKSFDGPDNFPKREAGEVFQLRPSRDSQMLNAVRYVFETFMTQAVNYNQLAEQLTVHGFPPPSYAGNWEYCHIREILRQPAYIGRPVWNRGSKGKYHEWTGGQRVAKPTHGKKDRVHDASDWIMPPPLFDPIIPVDLYERVQAKLAAQPVKRRAPRSPRLWLSGLVFCAGCNAAMSGKIVFTSKDARATKCQAGKPVYICASYVRAKAKNEPCECLCNTVSHAVLERHLGEYLGEMDGLTQPFRSPQKDEQMLSSLERLSQAHAAMCDRIESATQQQLEATLKKAKCQMRLPGGRIVEWTEPKLDLEALYRVVFFSDSQRLQHRKDELETDHTREFEAWKNAPTPRTKTKSAVRLKEIEDELSEIDANLVNAADQYQSEKDELKRLAIAYEAARQSLLSESAARRKAEDLKKVVGKIVVTFEPTGRKRPVSEVTKIEIVPANRQCPASSKSASGRRMPDVSGRGPGCRCL